MEPPPLWGSEKPPSTENYGIIKNTTQSRKGDGGLFLSQKSTSCLRRQRRPQNFLGGVRERWHPVSVTSWMLRSRTFGSYALRVPTRVKSLSRSAAERL